MWLDQKKICGFLVSRPYLRRNRDPKLFYWIMRKIVENVCGKLTFEAILGKLSLDVEALTKQNGVRLLRKLKKKFKKKEVKPTYPT